MSKRPKGRKAPRSSARQQPQGGSGKAQVTSVPASVGMVLPRASFKRGGLAQALTDQDPGSSERIVGCDLFDEGIWSDNVGAFKLGFAASASATVPQFTNLTPSLISARLQAIEEMYQWYAIRRLKVHLVPNVGSNSNGSLALGIATDPELQVSFSTPTQQQVLELNPAVVTPLWSMATVEYIHRGTKLFESYAASASDVEQKIQATLFVSGTGNGSVGSEALYMSIWIEYEIDFYQQSPLLSSVDLFRLGKPCPRCRQDVVKVFDRQHLRKSLERKKQPDRDDAFVVLRTQEPSTGVFQGLQTYQGLESPALRRDETKAHSSARSVSSKG